MKRLNQTESPFSWYFFWVLCFQRQSCLNFICFSFFKRLCWVRSHGRKTSPHTSFLDDCTLYWLVLCCHWAKLDNKKAYRSTIPKVEGAMLHVTLLFMDRFNKIDSAFSSIWLFYSSKKFHFQNVLIHFATNTLQLFVLEKHQTILYQSHSLKYQSIQYRLTVRNVYLFSFLDISPSPHLSKNLFVISYNKFNEYTW